MSSVNLNANFQQAATTNSTPQCIDDDSATLTQMQTTVDPYPSQAASLATTLEGELQRLRFVIAQGFGFTQWYQYTDPIIMSPGAPTGSNTAGSSTTLRGGAGTGTGVGGALVFRVAYPGSTGSAANSFTTIGQATATNNAASGTQAFWSLAATINQSGTAGYTALQVNATETATGSGTNSLLDLQLGGTSQTRFSRTGVLTQYGAAAPTNGQLLIGGTSAGTFAAGTLTAGAGVTITNGAGSITVASVPLLRSYLAGLTLSNNGTDATNDIDIAVGEAVSNDALVADRVIMRLTSALTKQLDAAWAVGTNAGMLDTGTIANTTYHIWLIERTDTGVVDVLASTSATAPTMPTSYTVRHLIGSILREAAAIVLFTQDGDDFYRLTVAADIAATNPGTAAVTRTLSVPTGLRLKAYVFTAIVTTTVSSATVYLSDLSNTDVAAVVTGAATLNIQDNARGGAQAAVWTNTSAQIRSRMSASAADVTLYITTLGWRHPRGRDS